MHGGKGGEGDDGGDGGGDGDRAPVEPEPRTPPLKDSEASEIEELIEELNSAIDGVNTLEDDHQRGKDEHLAAQAAMRCHINVLTGELRPHEQALISVVEACNSTKRAVQQVAVAEEALGVDGAERLPWEVRRVANSFRGQRVNRRPSRHPRGVHEVGKSSRV